jgi:monoamine oxidase
VGNLHFAGEHTSESAQGFMEGGCESGERVAEEILGKAVTEEVSPERLRRVG